MMIFEDERILRAHAAGMEGLMVGSPRVAFGVNGLGGKGNGWK